MCRVRSRCLISSAVWKPSMPGIWTSSRIAANSSWSRRRSASSPDAARTRSASSGSRIASRASRFSGRSSTSSSFARSVTGSTARRGTVRSLEREHGVRDRARDRRVRHRPPLRRLRVLDDRDAAVALDRRQSGGAVLVCAREHDPDRAVAVDLGDRLEEHVDGRPRELDARVDGEREMAVLDEEVVVGRSDVDVTWLERLLVSRLGDGPADVALQQRLEYAAVRLGRAVLGDHDRLVELLRNPFEQRSHCLQPSPRRADGDHLVAHRTFLNSRSSASSSTNSSLVRAEPDHFFCPSASTPNVARLS